MNSLIMIIPHNKWDSWLEWNAVQKLPYDKLETIILNSPLEAKFPVLGTRIKMYHIDDKVLVKMVFG